MSSIHPTAVIDPTAIIGQGSHIGPYCVIGKGVVLGDRCHLHSHVTISGPTQIGLENEFYPFCSIGQKTQDLKYDQEPTFLEIGNYNCFREFVSVHRSTTALSKTVIGHHGNFLAYTHIAHDCNVGNYVVFSNNATLAGHVMVEDYAIIGGLSAVHQFCRIGCYAMVGGCTKIVQDVPPFMIADGNPAQVRGVNQIGLERHGFNSEELRALREAYKIIYRGELNTTQAMKLLEEKQTSSEVIKTLLEFMGSSQRGIIR